MANLGLDYKRTVPVPETNEYQEIYVGHYGVANDQTATMRVLRKEGVGIIYREFFRNGLLICKVFGETRTTQEFINALYLPE